MPVRTSSLATIAAIALAFATPAAFAADQMSNSHTSGSSTMAPDKGMAPEKGMAPDKGKDSMAHSSGDGMGHAPSGKMSGGNTGGDTAMSHDKMSK